MKTTSFLISKKLEEVGVSEQLGFCDYYYNKYKQLKIIDQKSYTDEPEETMVDCFAYDLETILEALPKKHDFFIRILYYECRGVGKHEKNMSISYQNFDGFDKLLTLEQEKGESLADTAARLLILLHNKGLINFNEVK